MVNLFCQIFNVLYFLVFYFFIFLKLMVNPNKPDPFERKERHSGNPHSSVDPDHATHKVLKTTLVLSVFFHIFSTRFECVCPYLFHSFWVCFSISFPLVSSVFFFRMVREATTPGESPKTWWTTPCPLPLTKKTQTTTQNRSRYDENGK